MAKPPVASATASISSTLRAEQTTDAPSFANASAIRLADAPPRAGDDRHLVLQPHLVPPDLTKARVWGKADDRRKHAKRSKYGKALVKATIGDALSGVPTRERRRPLAHQKLAVHPLVETSDRLRRLQNWRSVSRARMRRG